MKQLYSDLKFLGFADHLAALRAGRVVAPVHVRIKPTNRCNHDCWYCAYKAGGLQLGEEMAEVDTIPLPKMEEIVDDLVAMGVRAVTFSGGGEPLLYKPLPEIVERLARGGVKVAAISNGSNLKGRVAEAFLRYGTWVRVSCDGWDDASYGKARGIGDRAFSQLLRNMRDFTGRGSSCLLGVSFIVTPDNHEHLAEACALFKGVGASHVKVSSVVVDNDGRANDRYHEGIRERVRAEIECARGLDDDRFVVIDHYHGMGERFHKSYTTCPFLQFLTVIGADCRVYSCQDKAYTERGLLGSIRERSFRDFWFSEENRARIYGLDPSRVCGHHCATHKKNLSIFNVLNIDPDHGVFV
ncbi:MAG: radical SAM protein [Magnetococcales bacterium]|nr:radical SAM protein [Magnetococcales bacterium]